MPKIEPYKGKNVITAKTRNEPDPRLQDARWWLLDKPAELTASLFGVVKYLKENQNWRQNQAALYARLYGNLPIWNYLGPNVTKLNAQYRFPNDRPTLNVVQSCTDGLISRLVQSKPKPMFLTDGGDTKKRKIAKNLNKFVDGEFYQVKAYPLGEQQLRDAVILGDGFLKIIETDDKRVGVERRLCTEIFVDEADGMYGFPQQLHELSLVDRDIVAALYPEKQAAVMRAQPAYFDSTAQSQYSIVSQIMVCESYHLPSSKNSKDGRRVVAIDGAVLDSEDWDEDDFPYVKFPYAPRTLGYWGQGLAEQLMGIQSSINQLLMTIHQSLYLCAVPKWLVEVGSKVVSAHINNQIGGIIKYQGVMPELKVFQCLPPELYAQLERLVTYAYQQSGISMLAAASQKPKGLDSGAALREYDDLQSDRFAYLSQRREESFLDLAKQIFRKAKKIAKRDGKYETVMPGDNALERISFPKEELKDDDFIIQAFPVSAFSKNPAERKQEIIELMQGGLMDPEEGRRQLDYPDLKQEETLANAPEERILKILDEIVEEGKYTPPDPFIKLELAKKKVVEYYNQYAMTDLSQDRLTMLRTFSTQLDAMVSAAQSAAGPASGMTPQANPTPTPTSPMVPNVNQAAA